VLVDAPSQDVLLPRDPGTGQLYFTRLTINNQYVTVDVSELLDAAASGG
jgi:hypothetical protein